MACLTNKRILVSLIGLASIAYPFTIYFLGGTLPISTLAMGLIALLVLRAILQYRSHSKSDFYMSMLIATIMTSLILWDGELAGYFYPVLMSLGFATVLGWSLLVPPTLIERFARLVEPHLDERGVIYTRKVTYMWLGFSLFNAFISFLTILSQNQELWLLYNGLISYVLVGLLMGGEFIVRKWYRSKQEGSSE